MVLLDSNSSTVSDHMRVAILRARTADLALGILPPDRMGPLVEDMARLRGVRLLLGANADRMDPFRTIETLGRTDRAHDAREAERYADRRQLQQRAARLRESLRRLIGYLPQTEADYQAVCGLRALLEKGTLDVRAVVRERLPQDILLTRDEAGRTAAMFRPGSFLAAEADSWTPFLSTTNERIVAPLQERFETAWDEALPFRDALRQELTDSWACRTTTPYLLYLSVLYRLVADRLTETAEEDDGDWMRDFPPLTDFQQVAVRQALSILNQYRGVFVADVVGLGKTYIGTALLKRLTHHGMRATIFCPPSLVEMWREMNDVYGLGAIVMSTGRLAQYGEEELHRPEFQTHDRQVVLIDESHRFRNRDTESYRVLSDYAQSRASILLTATPYSLRPRDIYHQVRLFAEDDLDLGLDPPRLNEFFTAVEANHASLVDALRPLLIRRTRKHIQKYYPDAAITVRLSDGTSITRPLIFPRREKPEVVRYDVEGVYGIAGQYDYMVRMLGTSVAEDADAPSLDFEPNVMTYARYGLHSYVLPGFRDKEPYKGLQQAGVSVRGFIRILLFKRLESSVYAFQRTVDTLLRVHDNFLKALRQGYVPAGDQAQRLLYEQAWVDEAELADALADARSRYAPEAFDLPRLTRDIENDAEVLAELKALLAPITPDRDDKLQTLRRLLTGPLANQKALLFTQFEATAEYLADNLSDLPRVTFLSGKHRAAGRSFMQTVARFAPRSNPRFADPTAEPVDTLIATDVLSEGLNLQDCSIVANYDLHYNPVRLIQRVGRVDRVGSEAGSIRLFNFLPERNVEKVLHLEEVLKRRIEDIHSFVGEDNQILHPDERLNEQDMYAAYTTAPDSEGDTETGNVVDYTEIEERIRALQRNDPDLFRQIRDLPSGVRSARMAADGERGIFVCFTTDEGFDRLAVINPQGKVMHTSIEEVLHTLECGPDEKEQQLPPRYNTRVSDAFAAFEVTAAQRQTDRKTGPRLGVGQQYAVRQIVERLRFEENDERRVHLTRMERAIRGRLPDAALRELNRLRRLTLPAEQMLMRLEMLYRDMDLARYIHRDDETPTVPLTRIVCSEALL